jgi:hypothetical protein
MLTVTKGEIILKFPSYYQKKSTLIKILHSIKMEKANIKNFKHSIKNINSLCICHWGGNYVSNCPNKIIVLIYSKYVFNIYSNICYILNKVNV